MTLKLWGVWLDLNKIWLSYSCDDVDGAKSHAVDYNEVKIPKSKPELKVEFQHGSRLFSEVKVFIYISAAAKMNAI